jgi:predicted nucleotidyltransferase
VWEDEEYKHDILWAGIFGSVARNCVKENSDVNVLIVLKEHEHSGEPIDLHKS